MDSVLRAAIVYFFLLVIFRLSGNRTLNEATLFDFVLVLIIAEVTENPLLGEDPSITNAFVAIITLVMIDIGFSIMKQRSRKMEKLVDGVPVIVVENGKPIKDRMNEARIDEDDVLEAARELQGIERMDQIKYAVLEKNGMITIIPKTKNETT